MNPFHHCSPNTTLHPFVLFPSPSSSCCEATAPHSVTGTSCPRATQGVPFELTQFIYINFIVKCYFYPHLHLVAKWDGKKIKQNNK